MGGWFNPASGGGSNVGRMVSHENAGAEQQVLRMASSGLTLTSTVIHATTSATSTTTSALTTNAWNCVIVTYNASDKKLRIYAGTPGSAMSEATYATQTAGAGAMTTGATKVQIGDRQQSGFDFDGKIGPVFATQRLLSVDDIERFRQGDWLTLWDGTVVPNYYVPLDSANNVQDIARQITFTVSGATYSAENPPTGAPGGVQSVARIGIPSQSITPTKSVTVTPGTTTVTSGSAANVVSVGPTVGVSAGSAAVVLAGTVDPVTITVTPGSLSFTIPTAISPAGPTVGVAPGTPLFHASQSISPTGPTVHVGTSDLQVLIPEVVVGDPTLIAEAAFGLDPADTTHLIVGDPSRGLVGTALVGSDDLWLDISQWVRVFSYDGGKDRASDSFKAATCTIELNNNDGRFDPANLSGPYVAAGQTQVTPMRRIRIRSALEHVAADIHTTRFEGFLDDIVLSYPSPNLAIATLSATDGSKILAKFQPSAVAPIGAGEDSGARINRILDNAGWPTTDRDIDVGDVTLQATSLDAPPLQEIDLVVFCEGGDWFISQDGKVTSLRRSAKIADLPVAVDAFSDQDYATFVVKNDADLIINDIAYTSPDATGAVESAEDTYRPSADAFTDSVTGSYTNVASPTFDSGSFLQGSTVGLPWQFDATMGAPAEALTGKTITGVAFYFVGVQLGGRVYVPRLTISGNRYNLSDAVCQFGNGPTTQSFSRTSNPATGLRWTVTDIEAFASTSSVGFGASPSAISGDQKVFQIWMTVDYEGASAGGDTQTAADSASQRHYLVRSEKRDDLILQTNAATANLASWRLWTRKTHEQRFESVTFKPRRDTTGELWGRLLSLAYYDRITLSNTPPSGITSTGDYYIIGIAERGTPNDVRTITFALESATAYTGFLLVDNPTLGLVGTGRVG